MGSAVAEHETDSVYSVTELAVDLGITARAIRYYESKGLLSPRRAGKIRVYSHRERGRLQIILRGKRLGFSLADIGEYLDLYDADATQHEQLVLLLDRISTRLTDLEQQKGDLATLLAELRDIRSQTLAALELCEHRNAVGQN
ncbi:MAG: MerR family transcriptional regulator [Proteobacteria bacterium]|jgi:DNA-binding transcriptional MerR regulator|nr:MerR family transcriptional regulator [Pseudomonadota bacterium]MBP09618.1 MerR family transcriptional regulator [Acidiferrobacteraceae bacterium]MDP6135613.1 MerR family DNA-binding transcriptional regulator [Arenicellales bacterium]HCF72885.1 MerR family transcriptional regulator [Gammaproteobacteria bacterium]HJP10682.1 MerR family DNA-binding transcriptional regulator [Arenicellales bacterium]|tara:strand:+ start:79 stop:507 length:429 start_codon:yes stop_codon:yes gene_type:complete